MRNIFRTMSGAGCVRLCARCKTDQNAHWSETLQFYVCDSCFTDIMDEKEDSKALEKANEHQQR